MTETSDVRARLRAAILRGAYAPKQRLIEAELAEEYSTSRFTLRNALIALAAEGLVELQPNRGARLREVSPSEAIEISEIRQAVEGLVAARAAENISDEQARSLEQLGRDMRAAIDAGEHLRYSELNATLHTSLREIANHATATRILEQLNAQVVRHQFRLALIPGRPEVSLEQHLAIIEAVSSRDPVAAREKMMDHISSVITALSTIPSGAKRPTSPADARA